MSTPGEAGCNVHAALTGASGEALLRIVALLERPGAKPAEVALLEHARARLRQLRPPRPLGLERLLYLPFAKAIRDTPQWLSQREGLPRAALPTLAAQVRDADPGGWDEVQRSAQGLSEEDEARVAECGVALWRLASLALPYTPPPDWEAATGLSLDDHAALAPLCIAVWRHAGEIWAACPGAGAPDPERLRIALAEPARETLPAFAICLELAIERSGAPALVASVAARLGGAPARLADARLDHILAASPPALVDMPPAEAASEAWRQLRLLTDLETAPLGQRRHLLDKRRMATGRLCAEAFAMGVREAVLGPLDAWGAGTAPDHAIPRLEASARQLQHLAAAGRGFGDAQRHDRAAAALATELAARAQANRHEGLGIMDYARLVEILCGSEAAARLLERHGVLAVQPGMTPLSRR